MLKIDDHDELAALNKAVLAAKFPGAVDNDTAGDPVLAGVSNRIYDEMCALHDKKDKISGKDMQELRRIKTSQGYRGQWRSAVLAARRDPVFMSADDESRVSMAKCYLSPFTCTNAELREFLDAADAKTGEHSLKQFFKKHDFTGAKMLDCNFDFEKREAGVVLMLASMKVCHIIFSGVLRFDMEYPSDGKAPVMPNVKNFSVSSDKCERLELNFSVGSEKMSLSVLSSGVDIWM